MERHLNNRDILQYGDFNSNQVFFIQRWIELLNIHTHSKYAVRYLNTHQALKELNYVCKEMIEGNIKRNDNHLFIVFEEVKKVINGDEVLKKNAVSYSRILENSLQRAPKAENITKLYSIIYQVEYVIRYIEKHYLTWVITEIDSLLSNSEERFAEIENAMQTLASELMGRGWSVDELYLSAFELLLTAEDSVSKKFEKFFSKLSSEPLPFVFLFSVKKDLAKGTKSRLVELKLEILSGQEVLNTYSDYELENHISKNKEYVRVIYDSLDAYSGVNNAWQKIVGKLDILNFYGFPIPDFDTSPIILLPDSPKYLRNVEVDLSTKKRKFRAPDSMMNRVLNQLETGDKEVNRKLKSLFEFTRISDESLSPQSTFINLWIGIESFVHSREFEGGIENVKMFVSAFSTHNYIYSLIKNFLEDCNRCDVEIIYRERNYRIGKLTPQEALSLFWNEEFLNNMTAEFEDHNILLSYRLRELCNILKDGKKCATLLEEHKKNVQQHVHRLYRIRNSIVHSGQMQYNNTNLFSKHLYEYIEYAMSVVMHRLEEDSSASLEQIFAQVRDSVDTTIETLSNSRLLDQDTYINLLLRGAF
ncbi:hypothetical protein [Lysinibacillus telephonicus]|uniref:Apea-like HEPN domain-containing protein n=1 Tax=Lysinibacillus telephonicus TaxID=1714840 RepID=A0A431UTB9_9BACI|nr:hypothetical protein [Lysinibacillus telephonicus]RTQ93807.1 hypothetical protein EKG35_07675 [Lysinibacillus telephonicus]